MVFMELVPGFGLYVALYEISQYSFRATYQVRWRIVFLAGGQMCARAVGWAALHLPHAFLLLAVCALTRDASVSPCT